MRPSLSSLLWTAPNLVMSPDFWRMSYALFRTDGDVGRVVATRNPDRKLLAEGDYLQDRLGLSDEAVAYMTGVEVNPPLFVMTQAGLGLISNRYHLTAGLGLYLHIHTYPEAAARLINGGALGDGNGTAFRVSERVRAIKGAASVKDETAYVALSEAWGAVQRTRSPLFKTDENHGLYLSDLRDGIQKLAAFVGCDLRFTIRRNQSSGLLLHSRVRCYRPLMLEGILITLLSEIREHSATRGGVCRLEVPEGQGREGLVLSLRYPIYPEEDVSDERILAVTHSHLTYVGELGGLDVYFPVEPLSPRAEDDFPERLVMLDWVRDPAILSTSDLKARHKLLDEEACRAIPDSGDEILL